MALPKRFADRVRHCCRIINDILDFSKIEAGHFELHQQPFELRSLVEEIGQLLAPISHKKGVDFAVVVDHALDDQRLGDDARVSLPRSTSCCTRWMPSTGAPSMHSTRNNTRRHDESTRHHQVAATVLMGVLAQIDKNLHYASSATLRRAKPARQVAYQLWSQRSVSGSRAVEWSQEELRADCSRSEGAAKGWQDIAYASR